MLRRVGKNLNFVFKSSQIARAYTYSTLQLKNFVFDLSRPWILISVKLWEKIWNSFPMKIKKNPKSVYVTDFGDLLAPLICEDLWNSKLAVIKINFNGTTIQLGPKDYIRRNGELCYIGVAKGYKISIPVVGNLLLERYQLQLGFGYRTTTFKFLERDEVDTNHTDTSGCVHEHMEFIKLK